MPETSDAGSGWTDFEQRLTTYLRSLMEGEALILAVPDTPHYAQVLDLGAGSLHGEVFQQRKADPSAAVRLGWQEPERGLLGRSKTGTRNLYVDVRRVDAARLATMIVGVVRDLWSVASPQALRASTPNGGPPLPQLRIPVEA